MDSNNPEISHEFHTILRFLEVEACWRHFCAFVAIMTVTWWTNAIEIVSLLSYWIWILSNSNAIIMAAQRYTDFKNETKE